MRAFNKINLIVLTLLSITAGTAKIMQVPNEVEFFQGAGFSTNVVILFGVVQLAGGFLLVFHKTRTTGAILVAATLCLSTVMIFMSGKTGFGLFSILPVLMAGILIIENAKAKVATQ